MPKQLFQIKDFSGGLNTLKDAADIANNEFTVLENLSISNQGSIAPAYVNTASSNLLSSYATEIGLTSAAYNNDPTITHSTSKVVTVGMSVTGSGIPDGATVASVTNQTEFELSEATTGGAQTGQSLTVSTGIASLEHGYGLGYFETDYVPEPTTLTLTEDHTGCNHSIRACDSPNGFKGAGGVFSALSGDSAVNLSSTFSVGDKLLLDIPASSSNALTITHNGVYTVTGYNGNNLIVDPVITSVADIAAGGGNPWVTGTLTAFSYGDTVVLLANPADHTIDMYSTDFAKWSLNEISLRSSARGVNSKVKYYKAGESIRCADTTDNNDCKIQWYGFISRQHFKATTTGANVDTASNTHLGYYVKNNTLDSPTQRTVTSTGTATTGTACSVSGLSAGAGFDINITTENDQDGAIAAVKYELAETFIYDGNQESLPVEMSTTHTPLVDLKTLSISIATKGPYDPRISGGRIYIREADVDAPWTLLVDMDLTKGGRTKLSDEYSPWYDNGSATMSTYLMPSNNHTSNFRVRELGLITYEVLNGFSSGVFSNSIGAEGETWKDSVVTNNRVFLCNVTLKDEETASTKIKASVKNYPDRIMYSMSNRYDVFPSHNYIEVAKADAETYVAIESYADRLLAFKQYSVDIINIASPDDASWFLEESRKYMGIANPECVKKTQYGLVWLNVQGLFLYNGSKIINLKESKISSSDWDSINTSSSALLYNEAQSLLYVVKSSTTPIGYIVDLKKGTFVYTDGFVSVQNDGITNTVDTTDNTILFHDEGTHLDLFRFSTATVANTVKLRTKDFDFGDPSLTKRIYAVYITYKSDDVLTNYFTIKDPDGTTYALGGTIAASPTNWATVKLTPSSTCTVSKAALYLNSSTNERIVYINDMTIEYRMLKKRVS